MAKNSSCSSSVLCSLFSEELSINEVSVAQGRVVANGLAEFEDIQTGHLEIKNSQFKWLVFMEAVMSISNAWSPRTASSGHSFPATQQMTRRWRWFVVIDDQHRRPWTASTGETDWKVGCAL